MNRYHEAMAVLSFAAMACATRPAADEDPPATVVGPDRIERVVELKPEPLPFPPRELEPPVDDRAMFACTSTADCEVIEMGCCDHCNGGYLLAVNRMHAERATANHRAQDCGAGGCPHERCEAEVHAVCDAGACARIEERPLGRAASEFTVIHNSFAPR